jgi:hypothetical protein
MFREASLNRRWCLDRWAVPIVIELLGVLESSGCTFERSWLFEAEGACPPKLALDGELFFPIPFRPAHLWRRV